MTNVGAQVALQNNFLIRKKVWFYDYCELLNIELFNFR